MKERRYLITTALEETWPESEPSLFLGEWCLQFERKEKWEKMEAVVLPFHWSDFTKLEKDYHYLTDLYEKILPQFAKWLNEHHKVDLSVRYWRILIGPWLMYFIHIIFERWESVSMANELYDLSNSTILEFNEDELIPADIGDFVSKMVTDTWNHFIYGEIIKAKGIRFTSEKNTKIQPASSGTRNLTTKQQLIKKGKAAVYWVGDLLSKRNKYFIGNSYLGKQAEIKLNLQLRQFPAHYRLMEQSRTLPNFYLRNNLPFGSTDTNAFENFLHGFFVKQIPTAYLEGFETLIAKTDKLPFPAAPKVIFTSNFLAYDILAMSYTAKHVERGTKLVHGQHGGYGVPSFMSAFDHEKSIADNFLSWGWKDSEITNLIPVGILKPVEEYASETYQKNSKLLLIRGSFPRYTFRLDSGSGSDENTAIESCLQFAGALPELLQKEALLVRLYSEDYGYSEKTRWQKKYPNIQLNLGYGPISNLIPQSRIVVYSYNMGTGYLEYLCANIPTIVFWDMKQSPVSKDAEYYFDKLRSVGIFHDSPESAAAMIAEHWTDVETWWKAENLQSVRESFCSYYAKTNYKLVDDIAGILLNLAKPIA